MTPLSKENPMKVFKTLMIALFLLSAATAVGATEADLVTLDAEPAAVETAEAQVPQVAEEAPSKTKDCENQNGSLFQSEWMEPAAGFNSCGSCSSSNCNGALRGQPCWTGSGWGHCNIYSGGYRCSTGGWECQCGTGPLP